MTRKIGIVGYGVYIPEFRLAAEEIWKTWAQRYTPQAINDIMGLTEIAVDSWHDDVITMASDAGKAAMEMAGIPSEKIGAVYLGTCTNPYVTKASATIVAESIDLGPELFSCDCQFGSKSGTSSLQVCAAMVGAGMIDYGISIGSDSLASHTAPNDWPYEYSAAAGAAAYILGHEGIFAEIEHLYSFATDTTDFFRLDGDRYLTRGLAQEEEFIGYDRHISSAVTRFVTKFGYRVSDFAHVVLHQRNGVEPIVLGKKLGFSDEQIRSSIIADKIGDCGSACSLLALGSTLDEAKPGQKVLVASYGHGSGSDVFSLKIHEEIDKARERRRIYLSVKEQINNRIPITYSEYLRMQRKIIQEYV